MARLGSQQIAGYYPVPSELLAPIARTITIKPQYNGQPLDRLSVFDPCAGDGEALVATLSRIWKAPFTYGVELEAGRAARVWPGTSRHARSTAISSRSRGPTGTASMSCG